ncbi:hypothetical protein RMCBS344292_04502 [Rhizopus microsporus]|nr:hypothetical protein RMCBS344292_04502 [Rhizopus microsporus]
MSSYLHHINSTQTLSSPVFDGPVDHVVFVIHGIGRQTEKFGFFQKHLQSLFDTTNEAVEMNRPGTRVNIQYIPIEWHKHIHEETDAIMDQVTPRSITGLRMINNDYLADAFFYLSNDRGQSIINHVTQTFNTSYRDFMNANPGFSGKIAIVAYSLGGIITWDILSHQAHSNKSLEDIKRISKLDLHFPSLDFKPDYLFTLGSPLSAFLIVRNQDPSVYHPDPSIHFENIFHPYDPLGYRFEPLLTDAYKNTPAVLVDRCSSQLTSSFISSATTFLQQITSHNIWNLGRGLISLLLRGDCRSKKHEELHKTDIDCFLNEVPKLSIDTQVTLSDDEEECPTPPETPTFPFKKRGRSPSFSSFDTMSNKKICCEEKISRSDQALLDTTRTRSSTVADDSFEHNLPRRLDFVLQPEKFMGVVDKNPYLCGLTAHFSYWTHKDLMWHIVRRLEN